jgi:CubicO group peptidase (beta-lactamase class C family)
VAAITRDETDRQAWGSPDTLGPDTVIAAGSITKALTGVLLAGLVLDGTVTLEHDVSDLLALPQLRGVRLLDLATHRSGLPRLPRGVLLGALLGHPDPYRPFDERRLLATIPAPARAPGARASYSNLGFAVLGLALAAVTGRSYETLVTERVLGPLGMANSAFSDLSATRGHDRFGLPVPNCQMTGFAACGGVRSTATDLSLLAHAVLSPPDKPVGAAVRLATEPHATWSGERSIGLGWMIERETVWHNGGTAGTYAWLGACQARQTAAVVLATSPARPAFDRAAFKLLRALSHE